MVRLSDLIKQGLPLENEDKDKKEEEKEEEKKEKVQEEKKDPIQFRDLSVLRTLYEELKTVLQEEKKPEPLPIRLPKEEPLSMRLHRQEEPRVTKAQETSTLHDILHKVFPAPSEARPQVDEDLYEKTCSLAKSIRDAVRENAQLPLESAFSLITEIAENPQLLDILYKQEISTRVMMEDLFVTHSINVMVYAMKIGIGLGYHESQLLELGVAAIFHDVGMLKIPEEIVNKREKLTDEELAFLRKHPEFGAEVISTLGGSQYPWLLHVVLQEHEREGGQGYPRGLKAHEIDEYAKIVGMADVYEALAHPRPHRREYLPFEAVKRILDAYRGHFPNHLVKILLQKLSIFPIGSFVRLNSRAIGRVVETNESAPLRPTVEVFYDSQGKRLKEQKIINLQETLILSVIDSISEEDLPSGG